MARVWLVIRPDYDVFAGGDRFVRDVKFEHTPTVGQNFEFIPGDTNLEIVSLNWAADGELHVVLHPIIEVPEGVLHYTELRAGRERRKYLWQPTETEPALTDFLLALGWASDDNESHGPPAVADLQ